jgi:hypothetical protein
LRLDDLARAVRTFPSTSKILAIRPPDSFSGDVQPGDNPEYQGGLSSVMNAESPNGAPVSWPYVVLVVMLSAIGNNWSPEGVRMLAFALLALVAVGYVMKRR